MQCCMISDFLSGYPCLSLRHRRFRQPVAALRSCRSGRRPLAARRRPGLPGDVTAGTSPAHPTDHAPLRRRLRILVRLRLRARALPATAPPVGSARSCPRGARGPRLRGLLHLPCPTAGLWTTRALESMHGLRPKHWLEHQAILARGGGTGPRRRAGIIIMMCVRVPCVCALEFASRGT